MADTPVGAIDTLLADATAEVDDPEVRYKLRTARQLTDVIEQHHDDLVAVAVDATGSDEVEKQLHARRQGE
ncbi:hypothetical protein [Halobellus sp. H-GB7]|uniref:hypothetical protein n=1 Tax=Halobellus sp. H-GB7 TaxID=3069756 RepID=UPI0027AEF4FC|nr:hypothetical protein [Halobellus sp. H-GB7]MDQ2056386.1 hypothetical protein [Halobellus sp. H-GB7]